MDLWMGEQNERALRNQLRSSIEGTIPPEFVDLVCDLAIQAATRAFETIDTVCASGGDRRVWLASLGPAIGIVASHAGVVENALMAMAAEKGMRTSRAMIRMGGK